MSDNNFERMIALATSTFEAHNDAQQLDVNETVIEQLQKLHPASVSEKSNENGPIIWVLLIPTTTTLMNQFIEEKLSETELLNQTPLGIKYDALYLCSALTLPEFRQKGFTKQLAIDALKSILADHPIKTLFVWSFSLEGDALATKISNQMELPLLKRTAKYS